MPTMKERISVPTISFSHDATYDIDDPEIVDTPAQRAFFYDYYGDVQIRIETDSVDDDGNKRTYGAWFKLHADEVQTLREFLNRHYGK